jgi:hypothetical protein
MNIRPDPTPCKTCLDHRTAMYFIDNNCRLAMRRPCWPEGQFIATLNNTPPFQFTTKHLPNVSSVMLHGSELNDATPNATISNDDINANDWEIYITTSRLSRSDVENMILLSPLDT